MDPPALNIKSGHIDSSKYPSGRRYQTGVIFIADVVTIRQLARNDRDNQTFNGQNAQYIRRRERTAFWCMAMIVRALRK